jgi:hypothetical protein
MDILESILTLIQKNLLDIITILWIIGVAGVALGVVVSTVSGFRNRLISARLDQKYKSARRRPDEDAIHFELDPEHLKNTLLHREAELRQDAERISPPRTMNSRPGSRRFMRRSMTLKTFAARTRSPWPGWP